MSDARAAQACLAHLGEMASVVAHELRNGLAGIGSAVQVVGQGFAAGSEERLAVEEVRGRIAGLNQMARELARLTPPRPVRRASISAHEVLRELARALAASTPPVALDVIGPDAAVLADAELLASALRQLAAGAGGRVHVAVLAREGAVELRIERALADPRGPASASFLDDRSRGAELGRSLARLIVEAHGGELSSEQGGATVVVVLPRA